MFLQNKPIIYYDERKKGVIDKYYNKSIILYRYKEQFGSDFLEKDFYKNYQLVYGGIDDFRKRAADCLCSFAE